MRTNYMIAVPLVNKCYCIYCLQLQTQRNKDEPTDQKINPKMGSVVIWQSLLCRISGVLSNVVTVSKTFVLDSAPCRVMSESALRHPKLGYVLKIAIWLLLWSAFIVVEFGTVFFMVSLFYVVYANTRTGPNKENAPSAYSVFNPNCERIAGTFTAEQFEDHLRRGGVL